jgi:hypothetical protein
MRTVRVYRTGHPRSHPGTGVSGLRRHRRDADVHDIPLPTLAGVPASLPDLVT